MESKKDRFKRLAESRTTKILHDLNLLSNLANRRNYDYELEQVNQIFNAIEKQLKFTRNSFSENDKSKKFKLK
jgi:hypothetical protein